MSVMYEFAGLRFAPLGAVVEYAATGRKIRLTQTQAHFLLTLLAAAPEVVGYDELRQNVWVQYPEMSDSLKHLIQETKRGLAKTLKNEGFPHNFIEPVAGRGYRIRIPVAALPEKTPDEPEPEPSPAGSEKNYTVFKLAASFFYGALFLLGLLVQTAYQFDRYAAGSFRLAIPLILWNGGVMLTALSLAERRRPGSERTLFAAGVGLVIAGAVVTCLAMNFFLPSETLTPTRFQEPSALAGFVRDALIFNLPLGVFYVFVPFYLVSRRPFENFSNLFPNFAGVFCLVLIYSIVTTFNLLGQLLPAPFHGLFVTVVFLRFIVFFGLGGGVLLWAKLETETVFRPFPARPYRFAILLFGLLALGLFLFMTADRGFRKPALDGLEMQTGPDAGHQLFVNLRGANFDPETVCVRVTGADCLETAPCLVPNGALRKHSLISAGELRNVPLTLPGGEFRIYVQNGDSPLSDGLVLHVPEVSP
ncbi:MAG: helix-turn-helix domain-containing protein [Acidobacteria bacterium]|nr:helix-turn-helix domain-containing protein [Acidobacteriota bacterium]